MIKTKILSLLFCVALLAACGAIPARSQDQTPNYSEKDVRNNPPNFPLLFPQPTHNNGYEEWVQATDLIQNSSISQTLYNPNPTLALKRRIVANPVVAKALQLVRDGLHKPIVSPRTNIDENTRFVEVASLRHLARLLVVQQYVAFADGRVDAAIECMRTGLAFGYYVQTDSLITGLIGVAIQKMTLTEFATHLDQLSIYQCIEVRRIIEDFLGAENPAVRLMAMEKDFVLRILEAKRAHPDELVGWLNSMAGSDDGTPDANTAAVEAHLKSNPADLNAMIDDAERRIDAFYDQSVQNMRLPAAQRKPAALDKTDSPGAALSRVACVDPQPILDRYAAEEAQLHLIGVHVLIHRYRWDHNALPNSLTELHAPDMVKDLFTGSEVVYVREGDRYTLANQEPTKPVVAGK